MICDRAADPCVAHLPIARIVLTDDKKYTDMMNFNDAKNEILQVLSKTDRQHLPKLLEWLKTSGNTDF